MPQSFQFQTQENNTLNISLYGAENLGKGSCILYAHGFKGFKDWGFVPHSGEYFASRGFAFVCFNFSHNGIGADGETFSELDKFRENTFSLEVSEMRQMIKLIAHTNELGADLGGKLGVIGHSRGGGIALLAAHAQQEVQAVSTWASVSTFERYAKPVVAEWKKKGYMEVKNSRTGQVFQLGKGLLEDIQKNGRNKLNVLQAAQNLNRPLFIVHGEKDETVPNFEGEQLNIYGAPGLTSLQMIPQTGHTFGAKHPFEGSNPALDQALSLTADFFSTQLGS